MGSTVEFVRPDGQTAPGYFAPAGSDGAPGIVLFEEWWGLDDRVKATADRLASHGFNVLVPDLYRGRSAATGDEANHLMEGLDFADAATQDAAGAANYLRERGAARVGVVGFCMGGALTLLSVMHGRVFDVPASGTATRRPRRAIPRRSPCRCRATRALRDDFFKIEGVDAIERKLRDAGLPVEFHRYDAQHGFYNTGEPGEGGLGHYHREHAETAWTRTVEFSTALFERKSRAETARLL